ncbi:MAG: DUF721 domain-containing protein [Actinomycetota bacterium]
MAERRRGEGDPQPMGALMRKLVGTRGWKEPVALGKLRASWSEVVGTTVAARSTPARLERGVLTVRSESGAWASELTLLATSVCAKADAFLGGGMVREVRVIASGPQGAKTGP